MTTKWIGYKSLKIQNYSFLLQLLGWDLQNIITLVHAKFKIQNYSFLLQLLGWDLQNIITLVHAFTMQMHSLRWLYLYENIDYFPEFILILVLKLNTSNILLF